MDDRENEEKRKVIWTKVAIACMIFMAAVFIPVKFAVLNDEGKPTGTFQFTFCDSAEESWEMEVWTGLHPKSVLDFTESELIHMPERHKIALARRLYNYYIPLLMDDLDNPIRFPWNHEFGWIPLAHLP